MDSIWSRLDKLFVRFPILRGAGATDAEIAAAEGAVGIAFPAQYREFLRLYGGAIVGPYPIFGVMEVDVMGDRWSVVEMNRLFRDDRWPGIEGWLIVSEDHGGNPIGVAADGKVYVSDHGKVFELAQDFESLLDANLKLSSS